LAKLDEKPPYGMAREGGPTLAAGLDASPDAGQRFLQKEGIAGQDEGGVRPHRPGVCRQTADVVGLYLAPPENAVVISVDEKPGIQALSHTTGHVVTRNDKFVRTVKSTYRHNGTQNLFGALVVATGPVVGKATKTKKRLDFLTFMDDLLGQLPQEPAHEYHVIFIGFIGEASLGAAGEG
jgi:hypothetical protein